MNNLTYIEKFNSYLGTFINELTITFPEITDSVNKNYKDILEQKDNIVKTDKYVKSYMNIIKPLSKDISNKNDSIFKTEKSVNILEDIDFTKLWIKDINEKTRESIWKYLQILYVIGKKIIGDDDIDDLLKNLNNPDITNLKKETDDMMNMIQNLSTVKQNPEKSSDTSGNPDDIKNIFETGIISDIAKELTDELKLDDIDIGNPTNINEAFKNIMGGGAGGNNNFFNLVSKVGEKIQNKVKKGEVNQGDLLSEAQKMMGGLKDPQNMANIMRNHKNSTNPTKERLKKKLEKRNQDKK